MDTERLYRVYTRSGRNRMLITFKTALSQALIERLAQVIKVQWGTQSPCARRLLAVFVEMAQNVLHHSAEKVTEGDAPSSYGVGMMEISEEGSRIKVQSGNLIAREDSTRLAERIQQWTSVTPDERKKQLARQRRAPREGPHAGLGLGEIAQKTDGRLTVEFECVSDRYDFAVITAILERGVDHE